MNDELTNTMALVMMTEMVKAFIAPELEKRLGHPVTEWDWQVYCQQMASKERQAPWRNMVTQFQQQIVDQEVIKAFVWEGR